MSDKVKIVVGVDINGQRLMLDEDAARELYLKLKELFDKGYSSPCNWYTSTVPYIAPCYTGISSSGNYTVVSIESQDNSIDGNLVINGDLTIKGSITQG